MCAVPGELGPPICAWPRWRVVMTRQGDRAAQSDCAYPIEETLGGRAGFGESPALLVVDVQRGFTDPTSPLGAVADTAIEAIRSLTDAAHDVGVPVIYTICVWHPDAENWARKIPAQRTLLRGSMSTTLDERLTADPGD